MALAATHFFLKTQGCRSLRSPIRFFRYTNKGGALLAPQNFSDYESIKQQYKPQIPEYFNFARDVLDKWTAVEKEGKRPTNPAFWWVNDNGDEVRWSFEELGVLSRKVANVLFEICGLQKGDRVILILPRIPEWWLVNMACMRTGTILIPGTSQLTAKDLLHRLQMSKAKCIITDDVLAPAVDSIESECQFLKFKLLVAEEHKKGWLSFKELIKYAGADHSCVNTKHQDLMSAFFTSGTTGSPKMTEHSHSSHGIGLTVTGRYWLDLTSSDILWNTSDTGWAKSAWSSVLAPWIQGACVFVHHMPRFDARTVLDSLSRFPVTTVCSAPTAYRMLVQHDLTSYKFKSLQHCVSAGEPINPEVMGKWKTQTGLDIYEGYGQTETVLICGTFKGMQIKPGSMGKPSPDYDVQIIDENCNILPPGKEGDIAIKVKPEKPFCLFTGYADEPEKTDSTIRGSFYITGDRGLVDEDGYFWFVGRADDVINSAGYRIGPFEVESALTEHPAVVESAAVSSPDPIRGEVVKAFVVLASDYLSQDPEELITELQDHVKKVTAPYKYPRKMEFVQQLPKTISGKIKRNELRKKEWEKI
ncbi:PREDICTED: acyl-coenzyme A synthetase ACSM3, mitochondrial-like isoform X1 [Crocodylus porosus]|uniref:acyl-coenzyme A synthetase ACSM3, mitochondrial-like isoform X1 n=1 Tax=Crocodylus porosus TaxID=8502 RepID=UPI00093F5CA1|nr:PREDICTED: acyl-coenzyme A synthetase ACSM3, mitochondrial-like isoform X1 [Crocodylus porosus]XP_019397736.1 PREDICTED: acyl-coenzyme A synthetase ACSM3, mitochondrial-like isoform X1 [Crocodylus porosus]XP_019397737.1 PREDICTED: acyl-coenzyme A synthetase ACSM3, mitochondrial-like isoform X1 [Crocodylus porosus]